MDLKFFYFSSWQSSDKAVMFSLPPRTLVFQFLLFVFTKQKNLMYTSLRNSKAGHENTIILIVVDKYIKYPTNHGHKNLVFR